MLSTTDIFVCVLFVTAFLVLFLSKLRWPKNNHIFLVLKSLVYFSRSKC